MASPQTSSKYLQAAQQLRGQPGQWAAYESTGNCCVLAGPGSGKTKTLVTKLARVMAEDVRSPQGVACITFSNEAARRLIRRLRKLGLEQSPRLFVGTVHSFCLLHLLLPFAQLAGLKLPPTEGLPRSPRLRTFTGQWPTSFAAMGSQAQRGSRPPPPSEPGPRQQGLDF